MSKISTLQAAISSLIPDGSSIALGLQMEQMIPFAAGHEIMRQRKKDLRLIGPISDVLFDQIIGSDPVNDARVRDVVAAWVGNVMMGSAYNFRRAVETSPRTQYELRRAAKNREANSAVDTTPPEGFRIFNMTNFSVSLGLQAAAMGVPFLPTRTAMGSDIPKNNHFYYQILSPFQPQETLLAVRGIQPDVAIVHVQRADEDGNAHCWGNFGVMIEAVRAAKNVIVTCEEIVSREVIASDPNRTVVPGFLVSAVVECPFGAHPSPVQGYYKRDDAAFQQYHEESKTAAQFERWAERWVYGVRDRAEYATQLGTERIGELRVKHHAYAAATDFGY